MAHKSEALLVIDDPSQAAKFDFLKQHYALHWAYNTSNISELLRTSMPDAVLLNADELDVLKTLRKQDSQIPVILVAAHATRHTLEDGLLMGANDYLVQPIDRRLALTRIQLQVETYHKLVAQQARIAELEAIQREQNRLARVIRHDLYNPLQNLQMAAALLEAHPDDARVFTSMRYTLNTLYEMIDEFAEAFSIKSRGHQQHTSPESPPTLMHIRQLIHNVSMQYAMPATLKDITIIFGELDGCIQADHKAMLRILGNLLSNAVKYSPPGGEIQVWTEVDQQTVRICIADQGAGIPANEQDRLFTEFGRLSNRPTGQESSTGLGLWIVKQLTEAQGGQVGVTCPPDGGSIFWVELPLAQSMEVIA